MALDSSSDDVLQNGGMQSPADADQFAPEEAGEVQECLDLIERVRQRVHDESADDGLSNWGDEAGEQGIRKIGRFEIKRELGRGGSGVVLLAHDPDLNRDVALKVPRPEAFLTPDLRKRFLREAKAAAGLSHPGIVPIYEAGSAESVCYIVAEYCDGVSLAEWIAAQQVPIPEQTAALWVAQLADAVQHAHDQDVLHRDLKPGNVLLVAADATPLIRGDAGPPETLVPGVLQPKLTDFGLAKLTTSDATATRTGAVLGTPSYMAPEQAEGRLSDVDRRTDVYGLGAVLYEMLIGGPPFRADSEIATLIAVCETEPPSPSRIRQDISRDLEAVCLKCLEKNPARRYASAAALADDLRRYLMHQPVVAHRPTPVDWLRKWSLRHQAAVWAMMITLLGLSVVLSISQLFIGRANRELVESLAREETATAAAQSAAEQALAAEHQSADLLFAADIRLAGEALANNNVTESRERLARHISVGGEKDRRGFAWHYLWSQLSQEEMILSGHGPAFDVEYSPDGSLLASSHESGEVVLYRAETDEKLHVLTGAGSLVRRLDFSTGGKLIAGACDDGHVYVWDTQRGALNLSFSAHREETADVAFHPSKRQLATAGDGVVKLYQLPAEDHEHRAEPMVVAKVSDLPGTVLSVDIGNQGRWLAVAGEIAEDTDNMWGYVTVWDINSGSTVHTFRLARKVYCVFFSNSAELLAAGTQSGEIAVWNVGTFKQLANWSFHTSWVYDLAFAADDDLLVSAGKDSTACLWKLDRPEPVRVLKGHSHRIHGVALSPRSEQIATASGDGSVKIWQPAVDSFSMKQIGNGLNACFTEDGQSAIVSAYAGFSERHDLVEATKCVLPSIQFDGVTIGCQPKQNRFVLAGGVDYWMQIHSTNSGTPHDVAVVNLDFDGDGDDDRIAALGRSHHVIWQENTGKGTFGRPQLSGEPGVGDSRYVVEDCNGDSQKDVFEVRAGDGLLMLNPHEWYKRLQHIHLLSDLAYPVALCADDLDEDDDLDIVIATHSDDSISWFEQTGTTRDGVPEFRKRHFLTTELKEAATVVAADFTGDGRPEIVAGGFDDDRILLFENLSGGRFADGKVLPKRIPGPKVLEIADVDRDGHADVMVATKEQITWFPNRGSGRFPNSATIDSLDSGSWVGPLPATVVVYNARTNEVEHRVKTCTNFSRRAALSPHGSHLAVADSQNFIRIWELPSERLLDTIPPSGVRVNDLVYTPDGRYLLAAVGDDLRVWSTNAYQLVHDLTEHGNTINRIAVSPDSRHVATASDDLSVRVWSLVEDRPVRVLLGHKSYVYAVVFSPEGRRLATGERDGAVRIWDLVTGQELLVLRNTSPIKYEKWSTIQDLVFRDDRTLAAAVFDYKQLGILLAEWRADPVKSVKREIPGKTHARYSRPPGGATK